MEKFSSFERVVGNISEDKKEQILHDKGERFNDQVFSELKGKERKKTSEELQIISLVNNETNKIRKGYGLKDFNISPSNIHVISEEAWSKEGGSAFYNSMFQAVAVREQPANIVFMKKIFHEMIHFKSYNALQVKTGENSELDEYRVGLTVHTRDGEKIYFVNLNEAITEEMTKRFVGKFFDNSFFKKEVQQTKDIIASYPRAIDSSGKSLFDSDTFYAQIFDKKFWGDAVGRLFGAQERPKKIITESFGYKLERKILNKLIDKIFERNLDKFQEREDVFEVFAKGLMTGNILSVGRLIEKTFGKGTLRHIGELDQDIKEQERFVNSL